MADVKMTDENGNPTWTGVLAAFEDGQVDLDAARLWKELLLAVDEHGKPGTLTITVKVSPDKEESSVLQIEATATSKPPTRPAESEPWVHDGRGRANRSATLPGLSKGDEHGGTGLFSDGAGAVEALGSSLGEGQSLTVDHPSSGKQTTITRKDGKLRAV